MKNYSLDDESVKVINALINRELMDANNYPKNKEILKRAAKLNEIWEVFNKTEKQGDFFELQ